MNKFSLSGVEKVVEVISRTATEITDGTHVTAFTALARPVDGNNLAGWMDEARSGFISIFQTSDSVQARNFSRSLKKVILQVQPPLPEHIEDRFDEMQRIILVAASTGRLAHSKA